MRLGHGENVGTGVGKPQSEGQARQREQDFVGTKNSFFFFLNLRHSKFDP